ncbi:hypothetical protein [Mycobacterium sp. MUNTM1]
MGHNDYQSKDNRKQMNKAQLDARKKANEELGIWISNRVADLKTKGFTEKQAYARYESNAQQFLEEKETLERAEAAIEAGDSLMQTLGGNVGDLRGVTSDCEIQTKTVTGAQLNPCTVLRRLGQDPLRRDHQAPERLGEGVQHRGVADPGPPARLLCGGPPTASRAVTGRR